MSMTGKHAPIAALRTFHHSRGDRDDRGSSVSVPTRWGPSVVTAVCGAQPFWWEGIGASCDNLLPAAKAIPDVRRHAARLVV